MKFYGHDKGRLLAAAQEKRQVQGLAYPSGKNHVMLPTGQQINPHKDRRTKKERIKARRFAREHPMVPVNFPLVTPQPEFAEATKSGTAEQSNAPGS